MVAKGAAIDDSRSTTSADNLTSQARYPASWHGLRRPLLRRRRDPVKGGEGGSALDLGFTYVTGRATQGRFVVQSARVGRRRDNAK